VPAIIGRDPEREQIERFLSGPLPAALVIEGEPGIGKTTLWRAAIEDAERGGFRTLAFRPPEAERSLTFAGLSGLFNDSVLEETAPLIPTPRREALEAALLRRDPSPEPPDPRTIGLAVCSVLAALAAAGPLLLAIDDLQWLDGPSDRVLGFALRRTDARLALLATHRVGEPGPPGSTLAETFGEERTRHVALGTLSVGALGRLLRERFGPTFTRLAAVRLHRTSGGNPFLALEIARALVARGATPSAAEPLPVPSDVGALVADRLAGLTAAARETLAAVSLLARPTVALLERAVEPADVDAALAELVAGELIRVEGSDIRPSHPLIASVALARTMPRARRSLHRRLATVVEDVEERARHLALATDGPNEAVAGTLEAAAQVAAQRGATEAAAELAEMALTATPSGETSAAARRQTAVAAHLLAAGSTEQARAAAIRATELLPPGPARVDPLILLAKIEGVHRGDVAAARRLLQQALDEAGGDRATLVRAHLAVGHWADEQGEAEGAREAEHALAALELLAGREEEDPASVAMALLMLAEARFRAGHGLDIELLDRAIALERAASLPFMDRPSTQGPIGLGLAGHHARSIEGIRACLERAEREGQWSYRPTLLRSLAWTEWCVGDLAAALKDIRRAEEAAEELGTGDGAVWATHGQILAAVGRLEEGRERCRRALEASHEAGYWFWELRGLAGLTFCGLTAGDEEEAVGAAVRLAGILRGLGGFEPGWHRAHADAIEALLGAGAREEAELLCGGLEERAAASGHPWSRTAAARCRGMLLASEERGEEALSAFERSLACAADMRFERARTLLARGALLRRLDRRRASREALAEARGLFEVCGSPPWAERAAAELATVSGRVARPTELTEMERRVAELAAEGRTNQEIAARLFVSVRTIESHLSSVYRKLGIRRRGELAARLRTPTG